MEIITEYQFHNKVSADRYAFMKMKKGMYRLLQAGLLAQELLEEWLSKKGNTQSMIVSVL